MSYEHDNDENWWADKWADEADENDYNDEDYGPYGGMRDDADVDHNDGYCDDCREDFHSDDAIGYVDYFEDGPFLD